MSIIWLQCPIFLFLSGISSTIWLLCSAFLIISGIALLSVLLQIIAYIILLSRSCLQAVPFAPSTSLGGSFLVPVLESSSTSSSDGSAGGLSTSSSTASSPSSFEKSSAEGTFLFVLSFKASVADPDPVPFHPCIRDPESVSSGSRIHHPKCIHESILKFLMLNIKIIIIVQIFFCIILKITNVQDPQHCLK